MLVLAELTPLDPATGSRVTLRVASAQDRTITGLNGQRWWPAMSMTPVLQQQLFDGSFGSEISAGTARFAVQVDSLTGLDANARRFVWAGASVTIYVGTSGQAWPWTQRFSGVVDTFDAKGNTLTLTAKVQTEPFDVDVLTAKYAGTGGAEGGADLKNKVKPWTLGRVKNIEPILIDAVNSVYQFSAYGAVSAVSSVYERGAAFPTSFGDYANYAALVAATIPAGRFATCLAAGMIRLGAPAYGVITLDVDGDALGGTFRRKTGEIITRIATGAGISSGLLDATSLTALDTAVPYNIGLYLTDQITVINLAKRLALPCNAQAGISLLGKLFAMRVAIGTPSLVLDAQGRRMPPVLETTETKTSPPFKRIEFNAARSWRVHTFDEISFYAQLVEMGLYDNAKTYREGNIVNLADGSRYLYTATTPSVGNTPPNVTYWTALTSSTVVDFINVTGTTRPENNATQGDTAVYNGDASQGLAGWQLDQTSGAGATFSLTGSAGAIGGGDSFKLVKASTSDGGSIVGNAIPVIPGQRLVFRFTVKGSSATGAGLIGRINELNTATAPTGGKVTAALRTSFTTPVNDVPTPATTTTYELAYTVPGNIFWISPMVYDWIGGPTTLTIDDITISVAEQGADVTANRQIVVALPAAAEVLYDYLGTTANTGELPRTISTRVSKGGVSVKLDNGTTYTATLTNLTSTAGIDTTTGSGTKGDIIIASLTANEGYLDVVATVDGVAQPSQRTVFKKVLAAPPSTGGSGSKTASDSLLTYITTTSYVQISDTMTVTLASGERLVGSGSLDYYIDGSTAASRTATVKWGYRVALGGGAFTDFIAGTGVTGSAAQSGKYVSGEWIEATPGNVDASQAKSSLSAGDYEVALFALLSATGRTLSWDGTARIEAKV